MTRFDDWIEEFHQEHRETPRDLDTAEFLTRVRGRLGATAEAPSRRRRSMLGWSLAAVIPLALTLFLIWSSSDPEVSPVAPEAPLETGALPEDDDVLEELEVLEILDGFPDEDLDALDADSLVRLLEDLEFLQSIDTELLEAEG